MAEILACVALVIAAAALIAALSARAKAAGLESGVAEAKSEAVRRAANTAEEAKTEVETLRRMLARLAAGGQLSEEQVLEGRLWSEIDAAEAQRMLAAGALRIVDVRTPRETAQGIIPGAVLLPIDGLEERYREIPSDGQRTLVYCAGGGRSAAACEFLSRHGYRDVVNLAGGIQGWPGKLASPPR